MSRLILTLLVSGLFIGNSYALNAPAMQGGEPDKWYIEVQYQDPNSTVATAARDLDHGTALQWTVSTDSGDDPGYTVRYAVTADTELTAGIVPTRSDTAHNLWHRGLITDGDVFMMQIYGYAENLCTDGNATIGQEL